MAVNKTTDSLIAWTAENLKTQGVAIHKQAASSQLSMDTLKQSFADIHAALNDIAAFRRDALPQMAGSILEMDDMAATVTAVIGKVDEGKQIQQEYGLEIFDTADQNDPGRKSGRRKEKSPLSSGRFLYFYCYLVISA